MHGWVRDGRPLHITEPVRVAAQGKVEPRPRRVERGGRLRDVDGSLVGVGGEGEGLVVEGVVQGQLVGDRRAHRDGRPLAAHRVHSRLIVQLRLRHQRSQRQPRPVCHHLLHRPCTCLSGRDTYHADVQSHLPPVVVLVDGVGVEWGEGGAPELGEGGGVPSAERARFDGFDAGGGGGDKRRVDAACGGGGEGGEGGVVTHPTPS